MTMSYAARMATRLQSCRAHLYALSINEQHKRNLKNVHYLTSNVSLDIDDITPPAGSPKGYVAT